MLRSLGVKPSKALPAPLVESALGDEAETAEVDASAISA
jgi:hypothetical protein